MGGDIATTFTQGLFLVILVVAVFLNQLPRPMDVCVWSRAASESDVKIYIKSEDGDPWDIPSFILNNFY